MPCGFARIRTSFSCTSICRLVSSASCQLPVGIEQWSVVSAGCQWRPDQQSSVPAPSEALEADTLFPTDDWQLPLAWQLTSATPPPWSPLTLASSPRSLWQLATDTDNSPWQLFPPDSSGNWQLTLTTNFAFFCLIPKGVGPCVRT
jgi:hypothetical protein